MNGASIARARLLARPQLLALVPAARIIAGVIPQGTPAPAIASTEVATTDRHALSGQPVVKATALVQITVAAANYVQCKAVMAEVRRACRNYVGGGVTVHLDSKGPDFESEAGLAVQTQDLRITYDESDS